MGTRQQLTMKQNMVNHHTGVVVHELAKDGYVNQGTFNPDETPNPKRYLFRRRTDSREFDIVRILKHVALLPL